MAREPINVLLAIRRRPLEQARLTLATCLDAEAVILGRLEAIDAAMQSHCNAARAWQHAHAFVEVSAARLGSLRAERSAAEAALCAAATRSADARGLLTAARTASEAVEQLLVERQATTLAEADRRAQHALDDIVRARRTAKHGTERI